MEALIYVVLSVVLLVFYFFVKANFKKDREGRKSTSDVLNDVRRRYDTQITSYEALPGKLLIFDAVNHKFLFVNMTKPALQIEVLTIPDLAGCTIEKDSTMDLGVTIIDKLWLCFKFNDSAKQPLKIMFYDRKVNSPIEGPLHQETAKKWIKIIEGHKKQQLQYA